MPTSLENLRREVDQLNLEILELFNLRGARVLEIARHKRANGLPVRDRRREAERLDRVIAHNEGPFGDDAVRDLFREIIEASIQIMEPKRGETTCDSALRATSTRL